MTLTSSPSSSLTGKVIVIVGSSSGIGFQSAKAALAAGAHVVVTSTKEDKLKKTIERLNGGKNVSGYVLDVQSAESLRSFFDCINRRIDHLVFTASVPPHTQSASNVDIDVAKGDYEVKYWSFLRLVKYALPHIVSSSASSITCTGGHSSRNVYSHWIVAGNICAALESATRYMAVEFAPIRVNIVVPGLVQTEAWDTFMPNKQDQDAVFTSAAKALPVQHIGQAEELAEVYLFVWRCTYITGQSIDVNGGALLH